MNKKITVMLLLVLTIILVFLEITFAVERPKMSFVAAGTTSDDNGSVTVHNDYYIGKFHVTFTEYNSPSFSWIQPSRISPNKNN